jgi:hypothetical protein
MSGTESNKGPLGNEHGGGPATFVSPASPARQSNPPSDSPPEVEEEAGAELEIEADFRRKLAGLRRLSRHERPHSLRAARDARRQALRILREKRSWARHARRALQRLQNLQPA